MREIRCDQCGREFIPGASATDAICPSCGRAMTVPEGTLAAAFPVASAASPATDASALAASPDAPTARPAAASLTTDDAATRPVPPEVIAAAMPAAAPPAGEAALERPTSPPAPPLDAHTMPAEAFGTYEPPSLPRSRAAGEPPATLAAGAVAPARLERTQDLPPELLRDRGGVFDTRPVDASAVEAATRAARTGRRMGPISAIALLIVLVLGSGGAVLISTGRLDSLLGTGQPPATATATASTVSGPPTAPAGFQTYTASDGSYILNVPSSWAIVPSSAAPLTIFADLNTNANFEIDRVAQLVDPQSHDDLAIQKIGAALASKVNGTAAVSNKTGPTTLPLTSTLWTQQAADIAVTASGQTVTWHLVVLSVQHGQSTLLVAYFAPQAIFASTDAADFQPMLSSLRLVTPGP